MIVTNHHVVANADEITVVLADRREFEAKIVGSDERTDLAVLKIDAGGESLPFVEFRDSDTVEVGDLVLAIGNPFGVGQTVTSGIVSAEAQTRVGISDLNFFIQTDAAINPGNSGGALVDMDGRLIGINTAIYSNSGGSLGIGFAIPSNMVRSVVVRLHQPAAGWSAPGSAPGASRSPASSRRRWACAGRPACWSSRSTRTGRPTGPAYGWATSSSTSTAGRSTIRRRWATASPPCRSAAPPS